MTRNIRITLLIALLALAVASCSKKDKDDDETTIYSESTTGTLVQAFALQANENVLANLDSVHFTVDPVRHKIYNVDSLPMGTDVSHLLTKLTFSTSVGTVRYYLTYSKSGEVKRDTITYTSSSTDSLNFTGTAVLEVNSYDGTQTTRYDVSVNVHQVAPDTLNWPVGDRRDLPGAAESNLSQRTVQWCNVMVSMLRTATDYRISLAESPEGPWNTHVLSLDFVPDMNSLTACDDDLYLLDTAGNLYTSHDALTWTATGIRWLRIIGGYGSRVLGITATEVPLLDEYPQRDGFSASEMPADFPVSGLSQLVVADHQWSVAPQAVMVGGVLADGTVTHKTWGYDGSTWACISGANDTLPALRDVILVSYYTYDVSSVNYKATIHPTWLIMGGFTADGTPNRTTYLSRNQGITWAVAGTSMQWPTHLPSMGGAQAFVHERTMGASMAPRRVSQPTTSWQAAYIYLFGGYDAQGVLQNNVWRGVINRMTFKPTY